MVLGSVMLAAALGVGLSGCDYWPPALQAQIEQMRAEVQGFAAERAKFESQLAQTSRMRDELQARVTELTNQNQDLTGKLTALEQSLAAEREKAAKTGKPAAKGSAKAKVAKKPAAKKRP
ncbi:MAG: hypothetical protein AUH35_04125 [Nitrospirae bacterium 13_1_40CM_62_7]|nr:MAG: hypothetical protein AUH35_04125 [Nitrospirae bacterium 13_1_40CM_62_7]